MRKKQSKMYVRGVYYYKYVCLYDKKTQRKTQIPIKLAPTSDIELAIERKMKVESVYRQLQATNLAHKIKDYKFKWLSEDGKSGIKKPINMKEGIDKFIARKGVSKSTIQINILCLEHWVDFLGNTMPIEQITSRHLLGYVEIKQDRGRSNTSINMDLRTLRTMMLYLKDLEQIKATPSFKSPIAKCPINDEDPIYITELEMRDIMTTTTRIENATFAT